MDNRKYLLRTVEDNERFKAQMGKSLLPAMKSIRAFLANLPEDAWIDYLKGVPAKNIPVIIGCICLYIQEEADFETESIDFNDRATMIRIRHFEWKKVTEMPTYEEYRKKMQNNGSSK